jgi:hypothetical protein
MYESPLHAADRDFSWFSWAGTNLLLSLSVLIKGLSTTSGADIMKTCLWVLLGSFAFLVSFFSTTLVMSVIYPLDAALLAF